MQSLDVSGSSKRDGSPEIPAAAKPYGVTKSVYFRDPDGHLLGVYCDGPPEEVAKFPAPYLGTGAIDFANDAPDFMQAFGALTK